MQYQLKLTPKAQRSLRFLPERLRSDVSEILLDLRDDPTPADSKPGKPGRELDRKRIIRVDGLRIVYQVQADSSLGAGMTLTNQAQVQLYYSFDDEDVPTLGGVTGVRQ